MDNSELSTAIGQFSELMQKAKENILQASKIYVDMLDKYGETVKDQFMQGNRSIPRSAWSSIERVGRGSMYAKLLFTRFLHDRRVIDLPLSDQQKIMDAGVEYLTASGDTLIVHLDSMNDEQLNQVVSRGAIRSTADQRSYIESQKNHQLITPNNELYRLEKGKLHILFPMTLTKAQLKGILNEI